MKKALLFLMICLTWTFAPAQEPKYVGTHKCKACHKKEEKGNQYGAWAKLDHARAFETLKSAEAVKIAKEKGLTKAAHQAPECLSCHTVGFGKGGYEVHDEAFFNPAKDDRAGRKAARRMSGLQHVGCESCHGPGGDYAKKKIMTGIHQGELKAQDHELLEITEETCLSCHNEKSPTYKAFDYEELRKKISHKFPDEMK